MGITLRSVRYNPLARQGPGVEQMPNDRFDHLFIAPSDFDRAVAFYRDSLGWRAIAAWGELSSVAEVVVHPEATHWGTRWFVVVDPDGNLIAYEQPDPKGSEA